MKLKTVLDNDNAIVLFGLGAIVLVLVCLALGFFIGGAILYAAWNYGVITVFDVPPLSYWSACFLSLLVGMVQARVRNH
jgi:succinate dehydrogenase/fumarate reductase cytochrome b subunit